MTNSRKFRSAFGGHISIWTGGRPTPIEILEGGTYETDDKGELDALKASPEAIEVKDDAKDSSRED